MADGTADGVDSVVDGEILEADLAEVGHDPEFVQDVLVLQRRKRMSPSNGSARRTNRQIEAFLVNALWCVDVTVVLGQFHALGGHHFEVITAIDGQRLTGDHVDGGVNQLLLLENNRPTCRSARERLELLE